MGNKLTEYFNEKEKEEEKVEEKVVEEPTGYEKVARTWNGIATATTSTEPIPPEYVDPIETGDLGAEYLHNAFRPLPTPRYTGIRFDGFMGMGSVMTYGYNNPNYNADVEKYNKRTEFIMRAYTGEEIARLSETTLMSSKEELEKYIKLLTSLLDGGLCDIE